MAKDFLTINPVAARQLAERGSKTLVLQATEKIAMAARLKAPGSMKEKIRVAVSATGGGLGMVISEHPATMFVLYGTQPHVIVAKKGGRLKFTVGGGEELFRSKVNHPGTKANNFLLDALMASKIL
jgi:hypothetical protein